MSGKIQRKVERTDKRTRPDRHAFPHASVAFCTRRNFKVHDLAVHANGLFRGNTKRVNQSRGFPASILDRLARFDTQRVREFVKPFREPIYAVIENVLPFVRSHLCHWFSSGNGCRNGRVDSRGVCHRHFGCDFPRVLIGNVQIEIRGLGLVGEKVRPLFLELHLCSLFEVVNQCWFGTSRLEVMLFVGSR